MGALMKALSPQSSASAKRQNLWEELMDMLGGCILPGQIDEFEEHVNAIELSIPFGWREPLAEAIEKKRIEIAEDDVRDIMRDRFDFT